MALKECAPWIFARDDYEADGDCVDHEVSLSEAEAVQSLFASDLLLSKAEKEKELKKKDTNGDLPLHKVAERAKGRYAIEVFTTIFNAPSASLCGGLHGRWRWRP
jgi:CHAD domain-containing protein